MNRKQSAQKNKNEGWLKQGNEGRNETYKANQQDNRLNELNQARYKTHNGDTQTSAEKQTSSRRRTGGKQTHWLTNFKATETTARQEVTSHQMERRAPPQARVPTCHKHFIAWPMFGHWIIQWSQSYLYEETLKNSLSRSLFVVKQKKLNNRNFLCPSSSKCMSETWQTGMRRGTMRTTVCGSSWERGRHFKR